MDARKRKRQTAKGDGGSAPQQEQSLHLWDDVITPSQPPCNSDFINPLFDPQKVLLRRIFFLNCDHTKYLSVGIYPGRGYEVLIEFGGSKLTPILLIEPYVAAMLVHLPALCVEMCNDRQYKFQSGDDKFALFTTKAYHFARLKLNEKYLTYHLHDLQNMNRILHLAHDQQKIYLNSLPDILNYANSAMTSLDYIEPSPTADKSIQYKQLFEELKTCYI
jgi:hypothetical protein